YGFTAGYLVANVVFVLVRLGSIILAVLTFWYGLSLTTIQEVNFDSGNFNTLFVRMACLFTVCNLQAWLMWNFITFHLKRMREQSISQAVARKPKVDKRLAAKKKKEER
ncbi:unnamed protein product, partial [Timema podura]|nr:unnamed protein product [Timema podura]